MIKIINIANKFLNIAMILIVVCIFVILAVFFLEPLLYNNGSKGKALTDMSKISILDSAVKKYILAYKDNYNSVNQMFHIIRREPSKYSKVSDYVKANYKQVLIHNMEECNNNVYIVYYSINGVTKADNCIVNKLIIKLDYSKQLFYIYYDSLLANI